MGSHSKANNEEHKCYRKFMLLGVQAEEGTTLKADFTACSQAGASTHVFLMITSTLHNTCSIFKIQQPKSGANILKYMCKNLHPYDFISVHVLMVMQVNVSKYDVGVM